MEMSVLREDPDGRCSCFILPCSPCCSCLSPQGSRGTSLLGSVLGPGQPLLLLHHLLNYSQPPATYCADIDPTDARQEGFQGEACREGLHVDLQLEQGTRSRQGGEQTDGQRRFEDR